ncbi:MAG: hypothetical protein GQ565_03795 [Candidatus Aegiribacteria sp.]|nr:hypothetical protein [Candidatus Aegiribacteria sp.]
MEFPILHDPGSIELVLGTVYKTDPPKLVDHDYLITLGFKREVDEGLIKLLLFLGLIDENGQPSILWEKSRDPEQAPMLLGMAVRAAYGSLFKRFPNAYQEDGSVLMEFFRVETGDSDTNIAYMILTFKVLCDLADLTEVEHEVESPKPVKKAAAVKKPDVSTIKREPAETMKPAAPQKRDAGPVIRISINIDLDDRSDPDLRSLAMKLLRKQLELQEPDRQ